MGTQDESERPQEEKVQGEGDYEAARRYREQAKKFVDSGRVEEAARAAQPQDAKEQEEMTKAEEEGRRHRKT